MLSEQATAQTRHPKWRTTSFKPGVSGNPAGGRLLVERNEALKARAAEIFREAIDDLGQGLTRLETSLVRSAAQSLAAAELQTQRAETRCRLLTGAHRVIEKIRQNVAERERNKPRPSLREWLAGGDDD